MPQDDSLPGNGGSPHAYVLPTPPFPVVSLHCRVSLHMVHRGEPSKRGMQCANQHTHTRGGSHHTHTHTRGPIKYNLQPLLMLVATICGALMTCCNLEHTVMLPPSPQQRRAPSAFSRKHRPRWVLLSHRGASNTRQHLSSIIGDNSTHMHTHRIQL